MNHEPQKPQLDADLRSLDQRLARQMPVEPPPGLAERIFDTTVDQLPRATAGEPVIGRIGLGPMVMRMTRRVALAASLLLGGFALWWAVAHPDQPATAPSTLTVAQVDAMTEMFQSSSDPYSGQIEQLEEDLAKLDMIVANAWPDESTNTDDSLESDLLWLDEQLQQF